MLQGALCECCGDYDKAEEVYKKILEENEAHQVGDERERERSRDRFQSVTFSFGSALALSIPPRPLALMTASRLPPPARRNERAINKFIDKVFETKRFVGREEEAAPPAPAAPVADLSTPPPPAAPVAVALQAPVVSSAGSWVAFTCWCLNYIYPMRFRSARQYLGTFTHSIRNG